MPALEVRWRSLVRRRGEGAAEVGRKGRSVCEGSQRPSACGSLRPPEQKRKE